MVLAADGKGEMSSALQDGALGRFAQDDFFSQEKYLTPSLRTYTCIANKPPE